MGGAAPVGSCQIFGCEAPSPVKSLLTSLLHFFPCHLECAVHDSQKKMRFFVHLAGSWQQETFVARISVLYGGGSDGTELTQT